MLGTATSCSCKASLEVKCTSVNDEESILISTASQELTFCEETREIWRRTFNKAEVLWLLITTVSFNKDFDEMVIPGNH